MAQIWKRQTYFSISHDWKCDEKHIGQLMTQLGNMRKYEREALMYIKINMSFWTLWTRLLLPILNAHKGLPLIFISSKMAAFVLSKKLGNLVKIQIVKIKNYQLTIISQKHPERFLKSRFQGEDPCWNSPCNLKNQKCWKSECDLKNFSPVGGLESHYAISP